MLFRSTYLDLVATGTTSQIMALYADGAVLEDPVGTDPRTTAESIREFYAIIEPLESSTTLRTLKVSGSAAAFVFELTTTMGDTRVVVDVIEVLELDDDGLITSMRAYWGPDDMTMTPV